MMNGLATTIDGDHPEALDHLDSCEEHSISESDAMHRVKPGIDTESSRVASRSARTGAWMELSFTTLSAPGGIPWRFVAGEAGRSPQRRSPHATC